MSLKSFEIFVILSNVYEDFSKSIHKLVYLYNYQNLFYEELTKLILTKTSNINFHFEVGKQLVRFADMKNSYALITGATSGIGLEISKILLEGF